MQLGQGSASTAALLALMLGGGTCVRTGRGNTSYLDNVSMPLPADGAGLALEHSGNVAQAVVLLRQTGHGYAVFRLALLVATVCRLFLLPLRDLQILHFTFEFATSFYVFL
jgi:hypothetical protein